MVVSNRGAGFGWGGALDDEIRRLVELVTELGIEVENILFDAVTALLGEGTLGAQQARQVGDDCERRYQVAHQLGLDLIMDGRATADQARWIMELQEMGQAFRHISQDSVRIAALSLALQPPVEDVLEVAGASINLLEYLVEQTRLQVRNAINFAASRDRKYARMILDDVDDLKRAYIVLESRVQAAVQAKPRASFPMAQLLGVAARLESVGRVCHGIANAVLYDPPNQH